MCRPGRLYGPAGQGRCAAHPRSHPRAAARHRADRVSSLSDRIRGIVAPGPIGPGLHQRLAPSFQSPDLSCLNGEWRDGCFVVERRWEPAARHGREAVGTFAECLEDASADAALYSVDAKGPFLFFDLETTGLSGGAGTHAFLVGCGWFEEGAFVTRQFLMTRYADERPMLERVAGELTRGGALVSFNGKSFDAPLLETRYLFHRLAWPGNGAAHVDVLHPARRFWGEGECSLGALERQVLGTRRAGDIPGFEIPARYFQFVRSGDARPLTAVLEHNRLDLLSLAALTSRACDLARTGPARA